jgi:hypothetical protein
LPIATTVFGNATKVGASVVVGVLFTIELLHVLNLFGMNDKNLIQIHILINFLNNLLSLKLLII